VSHQRSQQVERARADGHRRTVLEQAALLEQQLEASENQ
jgi:hypothetical protein